MIIESIRLENFRSYKDSGEIRFGRGITCILGPNGAGKSTLLEGIRFGLYGGEHGAVKVEDLVRRGSSSMRVTVTFSCRNKRYQVIRGRRGESVLYEIDGGTKVLSRSEREITKLVEELTGIDRTMFQTAVYVRQGEISSIVSMEARERKRIIGQLVGIESLERAWEKMSDVLKDFETERSKKEGELSRKGQIEESIRRRREELEKIEEELRRIVPKIEECEGKFKVAEEKLRILKERKEKFETLKSRKRELEAALGVLENEMKDVQRQLSDISQSEMELRRMEDEVRKADRLMKLREISVDLEKLRYELEGEKRKMEEIGESEKILEEKLPFYRRYLEIESKLNELRKNANKYAEVRGKIDGLLNSMRTVSRKLEEIEKRIESDLSRCRSAFPFLTVESLDQSLSHRIAELERLRERLQKECDDLKGRMNAASSRIEQLQQAIEKIRESERCPLCGADLPPERRQKLIREYGAEIEELRKLSSDLMGEASERRRKIREIEERINLLRGIDVQTIKGRMDEREKLKAERDEIESRLEELRRMELDLRGSEEEIRKLGAEMEQLKEHVDMYIAASEHLKRVDRDAVELRIGELEMKVGEKEALRKEVEHSLGYSPKNLEEEVARARELMGRYERLRGWVEKKESFMKKLDEIKRRGEGVKNELEKICSEMEKVEYNAEEFERAEREYESLRDALNELAEKRSIKQREKELKEEELRREEVELERLRAVEAEYEKLSKFTSFLRTVREIFGKDKAQRELRARARPVIERRANEIFSSFGFPFDRIELTEDFDVVVHRFGERLTIDMLSGGENIAVALALRIGIAQSLLGGKTELIMLDEPTISLDQERREKLVEIIRNLGGIPQTIVVTHHDEFKDAADEILAVRKEDGASKIEREISFPTLRDKLAGS